MSAAPVAFALFTATLPWIEDDAPRAVEIAASEDKLLAVDVWATWCHTCLSMKNYVFTQPELQKLADRHVWLALDYDLEANAAFFAKHPVSVFPTFLLLDPKTERVVARWAGSGSAEDMARFFSVDAAGSGPLGRGQRALAAGRLGEAREIFEAALAAEVKDPHARTRMRLGWIEALYGSDKVACAERGARHLDELDDSTQAADYAVLLSYCLPKLEDDERRRTAQATLAAHLEGVLKQDSARLAIDDRSAVFGALVELYDALGKPRDALRATKRRLTLLERAAKSAPDAAARATFDYHRMQAYLRLDRHAEAIRMLKASEAAQPKDFNHPWRLAKVFLHQGRHQAGLAAIDRALARGYGGRKLRLYSTRIELLLNKGDVGAAKQTVRAGRAHLGGLEPAQVRGYWRQEFEGWASRVPGAGS